MTYSFSDFTDDLFNQLGRAGAMTSAEFHDTKLQENVALQSTYAETAVNRLVEVRDAALAYRNALEASNGSAAALKVLSSADARLQNALRQAGTPFFG